MSDSTTLVPAGTWNADASHSSVNFSVRHLGIAKLRGKFGEFSGTLTSDGSTTSGAGTIAVASISTGDETRDAHLNGEDFFNAAVHSSIEYTIATVEAHGDMFHVTGEITINGITKPLLLEAAHGGTGVDPWGNERVGVDLRGHISRKDFGMTFDAENALVSDKVAIELDFSLVKAA
jgi:polyisoprenoid-binding protein YceI